MLPVSGHWGLGSAMKSETVPTSCFGELSPNQPENMPPLSAFFRAAVGDWLDLDFEGIIQDGSRARLVRAQLCCVDLLIWLTKLGDFFFAGFGCDHGMAGIDHEGALNQDEPLVMGGSANADVVAKPNEPMAIARPRIVAFIMQHRGRRNRNRSAVFAKSDAAL